MNPMKYNKILAHNESEVRTTNILERLAAKFLEGGQNFQPTVQERLRLFLHNLRWFYTRARVIVTIIAPLLILMWYFKYRNKIDSAQYWEDIRRHNMMFFSVPFDIT
jgi:hypothetical protein